MRRSEGGVYCRKDRGTWYYWFRRHGHLVRKGGHRTKRAAQRALREAQSAIDSGRYVSPEDERATVNDLLDAYLDHSELIGREAVASTRNHATPIRNAFGDVPAVEITTDMVQDYIRERRGMPSRTRPAKTLSNNKINRETAVMKAALRHAWKLSKLARVPYIPQLPDDSSRGQYVERGDFEAIAALLPEHVADFARFAYLIPWRPKNIRALMWDAVDLRSKRIVLKRTKNRRPVSVPLVDEALDLVEKRERLRSYQTGAGPALSDLVFHGPQGQPICYRVAWPRATKAAGLAGVTFYDLKRSAITNLIQSGACDEKTAMEISGHRTRSSIDRYQIVREEAKAEALARAFAWSRQRASKVVPIRQDKAS